MSRWQSFVYLGNSNWSRLPGISFYFIYLFIYLTTIALIVNRLNRLDLSVKQCAESTVGLLEASLSFANFNW